MSDEDNVDMVDSEDDDYGDDDGSGYGDKSSGSAPNKPMTPAEKRAHHNMLERKRRDHIKDSFVSLRDAVPALHGEKSSRAQILKKAADYIQIMRKKNSAHQHDIEDLKRQNQLLETQIRGLERARNNGGAGLRGMNASASSPIDIKPCIKKSRSSESENSDGEFHMTSSPESATSSSNNSTALQMVSGPKKLKVLNAAK